MTDLNVQTHEGTVRAKEEAKWAPPKIRRNTRIRRKRTRQIINKEEEEKEEQEEKEEEEEEKKHNRKSRFSCRCAGGRFLQREKANSLVPAIFFPIAWPF